MWADPSIVMFGILKRYMAMFAPDFIRLMLPLDSRERSLKQLTTNYLNSFLRRTSASSCSTVNKRLTRAVSDDVYTLLYTPFNTSRNSKKEIALIACE